MIIIMADTAKYAHSLVKQVDGKLVDGMSQRMNQMVIRFNKGRLISDHKYGTMYSVVEE